MKLIFGVLVTVLLAATMAVGQQNQPSPLPQEDIYSQTVAAQAEANSLVMAANAPSATSPAESETWSVPQPGSMASNVEPLGTANDFYSETVAIQAKVNTLVLKANRF
jgi:hypothetical protein